MADWDDVAAAVRLAAEAKLKCSSETIRARVALGELSLLMGNGKAALELFETATADPNLTWFEIHSMLEQVQLFDLLGFRVKAVSPVLKLLERRRDENGEPRQEAYSRVVICSGHMIDKPGRKEPRFPAEKEAAVAEAISDQLDAWGVGTDWLAVCGGARGADLLFAEACHQRGARVRLLLAKEMDEFIEGSVRLEGSDWVERFHKMRRKAETFSQPKCLGRLPQPENAAQGSQFIDVYARTNLWIINTARVEAGDSDAIHALLVWDEKPTGDGPGGTSDFEARVRAIGGHRAIVNPTKL